MEISWKRQLRLRDVKYAILGDIPDMGKARFVRMRGSVKEVEFEEEGAIDDGGRQVRQEL